ncbi:MAG TPA: aspartate aminotransferase family protein, partial [Treponema sp.]|nr:aspartate aminotransferase family protein [Treponema sp.]
MKERVANNYGSFPVVFTKGKGAQLRDIHGKEYIDFVSGIGVNCLGHNHPALVTAIQKQVEKQMHISNYYISDVGVSYTDALLKATEMEGVFYCNSGAEANEAAIKLARKYGFGIQAQKKTIVTLKQSFHGRTLTTLSATGQEKFHPESFAPYTPDFKHMKANDYAALDFIDASVCAIMIEAVQGEGGVNLIDA